MSKFSVYLKELLDQRGEPIARVAKNVGIERTSIHKALKDERMLPYTAVRQLSQYLQLTLSQIWELNRYYEMLLQGEEIYQIQEEICELLNSLSQLHHSFQGRMEMREQKGNFPAEAGLLHGKPQVESVIQGILQWEIETAEDVEIELYLPSKSALSECLLRSWQNGRSFRVNQLAAFLPNHAGKETQIENLRLLQKILPLSLVSQGKYSAYYYFEENAEPASINPLSYFIITPHCLITMDQKLSVAQIQTEPQLCELYRRRFSQILAKCQPLNSYQSDPGHILESYMRSTDEEGYYTLMTQPCMGHYYTKERIERQIRKELPFRQRLAEQSDRRFERLRRLEYNYYTVFSEEGLRKFAQDGVMVDLPSEVVLPFDVKERRKMLLEFRQDIEEEKIRACLADTEKLPIPPYLTFTCDPRFGVHIYAVQGFIGGAYACNLHIEGASIGQSFCEFIKSLPNSKFVYSKGALLELLDELILSLEEMEHD